MLDQVYRRFGLIRRNVELCPKYFLLTFYLSAFHEECQHIEAGREYEKRREKQDPNFQGTETNLFLNLLLF